MCRSIRNIDQVFLSTINLFVVCPINLSWVSFGTGTNSISTRGPEMSPDVFILATSIFCLKFFLQSLLYLRHGFSEACSTILNTSTWFTYFYILSISTVINIFIMHPPKNYSAILPIWEWSKGACTRWTEGLITSIGKPHRSQHFSKKRSPKHLQKNLASKS